jgi:hypothetical protein
LEEKRGKGMRSQERADGKKEGAGTDEGGKTGVGYRRWARSRVQRRMEPRVGELSKKIGVLRVGLRSISLTEYTLIDTFYNSN